MASKLQTAKDIIAENIKLGYCGIFCTRNIAGDSMDTIYLSDDLQIDICYYWSYFEVFGLTDEEFGELKKYYEELVRKMEEK